MLRLKNSWLLVTWMDMHYIDHWLCLIRYQVLVYPLHLKIPRDPSSCVQILKQCKIQNWLIGRTKVFLKYYHVEELSRLLEIYREKAVILQKGLLSWVSPRGKLFAYFSGCIYCVMYHRENWCNKSSLPFPFLPSLMASPFFIIFFAVGSLSIRVFISYSLYYCIHTHLVQLFFSLIFLFIDSNALVISALRPSQVWSLIIILHQC